ncbi:MAG: pyrimidine 5'-nucleotidase [Ghiorsea sp.]
MLSHLDFSLAVIDLDNTLYAANNGVFSRMDSKMNAYIQRELQVDFKEADFLRVKYWKAYGSTLKGLMKHHGHDAEPFLQEVHDIQAHELLKPQLELHQVLESMKCKKVIHTNGTKEHAETILNALGIRHYFDTVYDIRFNVYTPKPCAATLEQLFKAEGVKSDGVLVVDDMQNNLQAAKMVGAKTAWIHPGAEATPHDWDVASTTFVNLLKGS